MTKCWDGLAVCIPLGQEEIEVFIPSEAGGGIAPEMAWSCSQVWELLSCPEAKGTGALSAQEPGFAQRTLKLLLCHLRGRQGLLPQQVGALDPDLGHPGSC